MKTSTKKQRQEINRGKHIAKERLTQVKKAVQRRDEKVLKQLNSPSMWG